ncbi:MAG: HD domain-containing phosphohydrolase [Campylobacterales bacterium]
MKSLLNKLKLIHKVNLVFYLAVVLVVSLILTFAITSSFTLKTLDKNHNEYKQVNHCESMINKSLKSLDYLTIENSLSHKKDYNEKSEKIYSVIIENLDLLKNHQFLKSSKESLETISRIKKRLIGYKDITDSLESEVKNSFEDGMYAVSALTTTSNIIFKELSDLNAQIENISQAKTEELSKVIESRRKLVIFFVLSMFIFMFFINNMVVKSILQQLELLKTGVNSFFDFLSRKRKNVIHMSYKADDEISHISKLIDSNMYIAEELLSQEREEALIIERKVKEATKEITELNDELEDTQREIVFTLGAIAEERSKETGNHVKRVAEYSYMLARLYGMSVDEALLLKNASPMHDIGKIGIPDRILNKPGKFTDKEFEVMKAHAEIGHEMLKHSHRSIFEVASIVAYEHHEKYNGTGYPRGIKGEEIHIYGRITAVADVFDALGSDRVYKKAWPIEKIVKLFEEERGEHFDPVLIDLFLDNLDQFLETKERIDSMDDSTSLSKYIEDFEKVE